MRKLILGLIGLSLLFATNSYAIEFSYSAKTTTNKLCDDNITCEYSLGTNSYVNGVKRGLTFYKKYTSSQWLDAGVSSGSSLASFTRSNPTGTNPATYIDKNGVIQLENRTTNGVLGYPRIQEGYYDDIGFHLGNRGLLIEGAGTNLIKNTDGTAYGATFWTNWSSSAGAFASVPTGSLISIPELTSISGAKAQRVYYIGVAADTEETNTTYLLSSNSANASVAPTNVCTLSFWYKLTTSSAVLTAGINWRDNLDASISVTSGSALPDSTTWKRYTLTATAPASTDRVLVRFIASGVSENDFIDLQIYGAQIEISPYATSFIPTTTAALTRNAETLKYPIAGNRTAATESVFVKFVTEYSGSDLTNYTQVLDNNFNTTGQREIYIPTSDKVKISNTGTGAGPYYELTSAVTKNVSQVIASTHITTGDPNFVGYTNGVSERTDNTDFTANDWTTYFYLGSIKTSLKQIDGTIQSVAIFNRALSATEVATVTDLMAGSD